MKNQLFPRKKWFWEGKPTFFLVKTKKNHLLRHYAVRHQKDGFFLFSLAKKMVLDGKTNFFLRKKMVLDRKTNFFLGKKDGFGQKNQLFPRKNKKKTSFGKLCGQTP